MPRLALESCRAILKGLIENDSIVTMPGENQTWYRFHDLFADFLKVHARQYFEKGEIAKVHARAGEWYRSKSMLSEAIQQLILAGDLDAAAKVVYENTQPVLAREQGRTVISYWLKLFPPDYVETRLELLAARFWVDLSLFRVGALPGIMQRIEQILEAQTNLTDAQRQRFQAEFSALQPSLLQWTGQGEKVVQVADKIYDSLPADIEFGKGIIIAERGLAYQMIGKSDIAMEQLTGILKQDISPYFNRRVMATFTGIHFYLGNLSQAQEAGTTLLRMSRPDSLISELWARYLLAMIHYELNHLETALQHTIAASELRYAGNLRNAVESIALGVAIHLIRGNPDAAAAASQELVNFIQSLDLGEYEFLLAAFLAREAFLGGKMEQALHWAESVRLNPTPHMMFEIESNLTRLHILLATGKKERVELALAEIESLLALARTRHNTRRELQLLAFRAVALDLVGKRDKALESLRTSLRLAEPGRFIRTYVDHGPHMARLLSQIPAGRTSPLYLKQLLAAFPNETKKHKAVHPQNSQLIEPLTNREMQVLEHLARRLSDKEIAQALVISPLTVKAHTDHIYQKLGVNNRQAAVQVGISYGILDEYVSNPIPPKNSPSFAR